MLKGKEQTVFAGVIYARADRDDIRTLSDIEGKRVSAVSLTSLGGMQMQWETLFANEIDLMTKAAMVG